MPWRLIVFIVIFSVFLAFVTFNLENRCNISFGFTDIPNVPVFLTVFTSFILGMFCTLPLVMFIHKKHKQNPKVKNEDTKTSDNDKIKQDAALSRQKFFSKRSGGKV